ncbi:hypothetical protein LIDJA_10355 [Leptospira interrogans]
MNSTERAFYGSPFWAQKGTFFKCSDKNESFYLQKVCFSDKENPSTSSPPKNRKNSTQRFPMGRVGKLNTTLSYGSRWKTQHNAFLWVALENSTQRFPMGRVGKLNTTLSYGSRWKTQHNAFLWVALENSTQRFPMGRVGKLNTTLSYGSRWKTQHNAFLWVALWGGN